MSRNFKSNLKVWLDKVFRSQNTNKKELVQIARKMANLTGKEAKNQIQDIIIDYLCAKVQQLKSRKIPHEDALKAVIDPFQREGLNINLKLQTNISQHLDKYFNSIQQNKRNYQDYVINVWDNNLQKYDCICEHTTKDWQASEPTQKCYRCGRICHVNCLWQKESSSYQYECPFCYLIYCLPNKKVTRVLFAGYLRQNKKDKIQYKINLPLQNISQCKLIQSRCTRLSNNNRYELSWPQNSAVYLNNKKLIEYRPLPINSPLKRRADEQIPLDRRLMCFQNNTLIVQQKHQHLQYARYFEPDNHFIVVVGIKILGAQQIKQELLKQQNIQFESKSKQCARYVSRGIQDCFIDKIKVKLQCQFYGSKIAIPVRSIQCITHYQPFDLMGFIFANMTNKNCTQKWKCPVCKKRAYHIEIDQYLQQLIHANPNVSQVFFNSRGEAQIITQSQETKQSQQKKQNDKQQLLYEEIADAQELIKNSKMNRKQSNSSIQGSQIEIIYDDIKQSSILNPLQFEEYIQVPDKNISFIEKNQNLNKAIKRNYQIMEKQSDIDMDFSSAPIKKQKKDQSNLQNKQKNPIFDLLQKNMSDSSQKFIYNQSQLQKSDISLPNKSLQVDVQKLSIKLQKLQKKDQSIYEIKQSSLFTVNNAINGVELVQNIKKRLTKASTIQIQSQQESNQIIRLRKLKYLKQQLNKDKIFLLVRQDRNTNINDKTVFNKLAQNFINSLIQEC